MLPSKNYFIKKGEEIKKNHPLFIIEAMKVMNEITSPTNGKIVKINSQDGNMVEFGEVVLEIAE